MRIFTSINTDESHSTHPSAFIAPRRHIATAMPLRLHVEWRQCAAGEALRHADSLKFHCLRICEELGLPVQSHAFFQFEPSGAAGTLLLTDSHVAFQTWPDRQLLTAELSFGGPDSAASRLLEKLALHLLPTDRHVSSGNFDNIDNQDKHH